MGLIRDFCKTVLAFVLAKLTHRYRDCWLICERGVDGADNGYWLYKYLIEHGVGNPLFCITSDALDYQNVARLGKTVEYGTLQHAIAYFSAEFLISTHQPLCRPKWRTFHLLSEGPLKTKAKRVYIQHGLIKDYMAIFDAETFKVDLFTSGAEPEYRFLNEVMHQPKGILKYTGLARYDELYRASAGKLEGVFDEDFILLMPTWRVFLSGCSDHEFMESAYYRSWQGMLDDAEFINLLKESGKRLYFLPHFETRRYLHCFRTADDVVRILSPEEYSVQQLLIGCTALITDYSSVFFDVAYQGKPTLYYQFDIDAFRDTQYQEGYFDYEEGFGPVAGTYEELLSYLPDALQGKVGGVYKERIECFFERRDDGNCKRITDELIRLRG